MDNLSSEALKKLVRRAKAGDKEAFSAIYENCFTPVFRYLYLRVKNKTEAEELAQTVFLKAYQALPGFQEQGRPILAYFFTIARNSLIDHWRKSSDRVEDADEVFKKIPDEKSNIESKLDSKSGFEKIKSAMGNLTEDQQEVLRLKFMSELSHSEIAKIMEKSEEAVRQLQCRALKALRQHLGKMN